MASNPVLSPERISKVQLCYVCGIGIPKKDFTCVKSDGFKTFKDLAEQWAEIPVPIDVKEYCYTQVLMKLGNEVVNDIPLHKTCRVSFRTRISRLKTKYAVNVDSGDCEDSARDSESCITESNEPSTARVEYSTRKHVANVKSLEKKCFICNETRDCDNNPYANGGLTRCSREDIADKLQARKDIFLQDRDCRHYDAAKRLDILLSGSALDIYAADIFHHQSCYIKFAIIQLPNKLSDDIEMQKAKKEDILTLFRYKVRTRIVRDKEAYFLHELLKDVEYYSSAQNVTPAVITHSGALKQHIIANFEDEVSFFPCGKYLLVHPSDINPCTYSVATMHGFGLRDNDLTISFSRMIRRKVLEKESLNDWPMSPEDLIDKMDSGPLPEIYNAIYYSMHEKGTLNGYGYAVTPQNQATKIWSLACDWESLVSRKRSPKQIALGLVLHRITGNKEAINILHKSNHVISYHDVRMQNAAWARMVSSRPLHYPEFRKGITTHSTLDNNDGRQDTCTGTGTTHDTNKTLFQIVDKTEKETVPIIADMHRPLLLEDVENNCIVEPIPYHPGKRVDPQLFPNFILEEKSNVIQESFKKNVAWALCGALVDEDLPLLGSWTPFNKRVTSHNAEPIIQKYLPVTPFEPDYPVCKEYLDFMLDVIDVLEIPFIFVHSDEMVYSKLCDILWKNKDIYSKIILLMGGFHQLRVMQRLLYKRHFCKGYKEWSVDAEAIAAGSADQAFEGRHYYRSMRFHKECFDALVQFRIEKLTNCLSDIDISLIRAARRVRLEPSKSTLDSLMTMPEFDQLFNKVISKIEGSDGDMTVSYLQDVSVLLSLVSAVRECNLEEHLQAERKLVDLALAFDHQSYGRYN